MKRNIFYVFFKNSFFLNVLTNQNTSFSEETKKGGALFCPTQPYSMPWETTQVK